MKKVLALFMSCSLLFMGCRHDDVLKNDPNQSHEENGLKGKSFVVTQTELEAKYAGNKSLNNILQKEFKTEGGLIKTNSDDEGQNNGVYIDLDHVTVFESDQLHTITYHVTLEEQEETDEIQEVYNLMYFSHDYETYYVTLLRYDFSQISFQEFVMNPDIYRAQLAFLPLNDIENIYENIRYSFSNVNQTAGKTAYNYEVAVGLQRLEYQPCAVTTNEPGQLCKGDGDDKHIHGQKCSMTGDKKATPGYTVIDTRPCHGEPGSSAPGGGGSVGSPGGGGGYSPVRPNPINSNPVRTIGEIFIGNLNRFQISFGKTNHNHKTLKAISNSSVIKLDLKDFDSKLKKTSEFGTAYGFETINGSYSYNNKRLTLPNPTGVKTKIDPSNANASYAGVIHSHPEDLGSLSNQGAPLFSSGDLAAVFRFANETPVSKNRKPAEAFIGAVNKYGLYMVMLPNDVDNTNLATRYADFTKTTPIGNDIVGDETKPKWKSIEIELTIEYQTIESSGDPEHIKKIAHEKALLQIMKKYGLELNIYFLPRNSGTFNDTWQQLTLNNNAQVQYTNIN